MPMRETDSLTLDSPARFMKYYMRNVTFQSGSFGARQWVDRLSYCHCRACFIHRLGRFVTQSPSRCQAPALAHSRHPNPKQARPGPIHALQNGQPHSTQRKFKGAGGLSRCMRPPGCRHRIYAETESRSQLKAVRVALHKRLANFAVNVDFKLVKLVLNFRLHSMVNAALLKSCKPTTGGNTKRLLTSLFLT